MPFLRRMSMAQIRRELRKGKKGQDQATSIVRGWRYREASVERSVNRCSEQTYGWLIQASRKKPLVGKPISTRRTLSSAGRKRTYSPNLGVRSRLSLPLAAASTEKHLLEENNRQQPFKPTTLKRTRNVYKKTNRIFRPTHREVFICNFKFVPALTIDR